MWLIALFITAALAIVGLVKFGGEIPMKFVGDNLKGVSLEQLEQKVGPALKAMKKVRPPKFRAFLR